MNLTRDEAYRNLTGSGGWPTAMAPQAYNTGATMVTSNAGEYLGALLLGMYLGSMAEDIGGHYNRRRTRMQFQLPTSSAQFFLLQHLCIHQVAAIPVATPGKMIETIRHAFVLKIADTAAALRVTRPTVYQWQDLSDIEQIRAHRDRDRLKALYRIALQWLEKPRLTGRWLTATLRNGRSVLDMLSAQQLESGEILAAHAVLEDIQITLRNKEIERSKKGGEAMIKSMLTFGTEPALGAPVKRGRRKVAN